MKNKTFFYARVSSTDQSLSRQLLVAKELGIDERDIYTDKASGKNFNREGYKNLINNLREGDTVVVYSIDRLGRNYTDIQTEWNRITKDLKCHIKVVDMPLLDTTKNTDNLDSTFIADLVLQILSYVAERERQNIKSRQAQGINAMSIDPKTGKRISRKTGRPQGRPKAECPENWEEIYNKWDNKELTATKSMELLGLTRNTFYNLVKRYRGEA